MRKTSRRGPEVDEQTDDRLSRYIGATRDTIQPWYETLPMVEAEFEPEFEPEPAPARRSAHFFVAAAALLGLSTLALYAAARAFGY